MLVLLCHVGNEGESRGIKVRGSYVGKCMHKVWSGLLYIPTLYYHRKHELGPPHPIELTLSLIVASAEFVTRWNR